MRRALCDTLFKSSLCWFSHLLDCHPRTESPFLLRSFWAICPLSPLCTCSQSALILLPATVHLLRSSGKKHPEAKSSACPRCRGGEGQCVAADPILAFTHWSCLLQGRRGALVLRHPLGFHLFLSLDFQFLNGLCPCIHSFTQQICGVSTSHVSACCCELGMPRQKGPVPREFTA